jgi:hypothetical protein
MAQGGGKPSGKPSGKQGGKQGGKPNGKPAGKSGKPAGKSGKPAKGKASKGDKGTNAISTSIAIYSCIFMLIFCSGSMFALYAQSQTGMGGGMMMI